MLSGWAAPLRVGWNRLLANSLNLWAGALQTKDGSRIAAYETAEECGDIFKDLLRKAQSRQRSHPIWQNEEMLYFTHDNATFFTAAELPEGEGEVYTIIRQPPCSHDCHKVIEHPIHPIKRAFRKRFTQKLGVVAHSKAMDLLEECIQDCVKAESILEDCLTLNDTRRSIITE